MFLNAFIPQMTDARAQAMLLLPPSRYSLTASQTRRTLLSAINSNTPADRMIHTSSLRLHHVYNSAYHTGIESSICNRPHRPASDKNPLFNHRLARPPASGHKTVDSVYWRFNQSTKPGAKLQSARGSIIFFNFFFKNKSTLLHRVETPTAEIRN